MPDLSEVEIRGEDNFPVLAKRTGFLASQAALSAIFAAGNPDGRELDIEASLIPEQANVHDSKAVRIDVGSKGVGYLASEDARVYRRRWGRRPSRVAARIISKPHPSFPAMDVYTLRLDLPLR